MRVGKEREGNQKSGTGQPGRFVLSRIDDVHAGSPWQRTKN
jgi:hypothetical protein